MRAKTSVAILVLLVISVASISQTVKAAGPVDVAVNPASIPVGQSFDIAFRVTQSFSGTATATVHIRACNSCSDIWSSGPLSVVYGHRYDVYPSGMSTPGSYIAFVAVIIPGPMGGTAIAGYASFQVVGSTTPFDFSLSLSPPSITLKPGETATFQILLTYSDPSYSGTTIHVEVSGMGPGMNYQVIPGPPTLRVSTSQSTPPGNYQITLTGSANGVMHQASAFVVVQPPEQPFDFSISVSPQQQTITPGGSTTYTVTVGLVSGSAQNVALTVTGAPNGVTASLNPASGTPSFNSILSVTTISSAAPGQYLLTITGTSGATNHPATVTLTIGQAPDFRLDVTPPSQTLTQGQTTSYSINVASLNGFNSQVSLAVEGLPSGVSGTFSVPSSIPDFSSTLTLTIPSNSPTGSFTLTISGSGGGIERFANAILVINPTQMTTIQTTSAVGGIPETLQQNSPIIIGVLALLVILLAALALRGRGRRTVPQQTRMPRIFCGKCGTENPASNEFCASCGNKLKAS